ncbi:MAG: NAD-dependent epimerase/dehydratase family protein, partial [Myxococcota bacterium]
MTTLAGPILVIGANGQDGRYLVRSLMQRGAPLAGIDLGGESLEPVTAFYHYESVDLRETSVLQRVLSRVDPDYVFHVAAVHASSGGASYERQFEDMLAVNVRSVHTVLEFFRQRPTRPGHLLYASSIKAFGEPLTGEIGPSSPRRSTCLYGVTKNAAHDVIEHYRRCHAVAAGTIFLSNHESPLRPPGFFSTDLAAAVARIISSSPDATPIEMRSLDFFCDWGSAAEYADFMVELLTHAPGRDFVLAR